uniref:Uncharacterized protein n=1 Tax=Nelumbo nucifera TaxID=4432 RepID=A0A822ZPY2_NELNU|nr:TPA_asm: hypothetical protein HUJ06_017981 [Nelumbo nucifera]
MFPATMSNSTFLSEEASVSSGTRVHDLSSLNPMFFVISQQPQQQNIKKKRNLPGNPSLFSIFVNIVLDFLQLILINLPICVFHFFISDPDAEVITLSPKTLLTTNKFVCEICSNKGFVTYPFRR